ncbi:PD-(D/E)XK nuclease family transposase [uncultured Robinsoniella sp.]|uniref:PD-(D/E)XK nuclease family transposase n=1 Tax=uncultured Robinsoniella sp. TaxID=904190 RepID=UPI00374EDAD4
MDNSPKTNAIQNENEKTEPFIMLPTVDFCFKELMCSEKVRKGLIAAFLKDTDAWYSCFHLREDQRGSLYSDKLELHVLELPKLVGQEEPENELLQWAKFLNGKREEDFREMAEKNEYINEAYQIIKHISEDERKRYEYESREKAIRDHNHILYMAKKEVKEAKEKAEEERKKALAEGLADGLEESIKLFIHYNLSEGYLHERIVENLKKCFNLDHDSAEEYYDKYK